MSRWSLLLPQVPYLLLAVLLPMAIFRLQVGPKTRATILQDLPRLSATRLLLASMFWTSDKVLFWLPPMGAVFERWDEESARRARQSGSSSRPSSSRHEHDMRLVRLDSVIVATCSGCGKRVPVRPPRSARRNVAQLERWLDRVTTRVTEDQGS